jgi:D-alanine-D-alanine ligase-like ATP-grasp enzyme
MKHPFASRMISRVAPSLGIKVELEPEYGFVGELIFPDGRRHLFRNTNFNLNPAGSTEIAKDKQYTSYFLRKFGFNVPKSKAFFSDCLNSNLAEVSRRSIHDAAEYAMAMGFPVFVKPNNLSQGILVVKAHSLRQLHEVSRKIFEKTEVMMVQEPVDGLDYRVVILHGEVISAYERIPLQVTGNGLLTIDELLVQAKNNLETSGRSNADIHIDDFRIDQKLSMAGLTRSSVAEMNQTIVLLDNANLSSGGCSRDITSDIHQDFIEIARKAAQSIGLVLCGVDIIADDLTACASTQNWAIIELNAAPGLDNYASIGEVQMKRVEDMYRRVLLSLAHVSNLAAS